jgi:hypothetical protein
MEARSVEIRQNMDSASSTVSNAANAFSANMQQFEQDVRPVLESRLEALQSRSASNLEKAPEIDEMILEKKRRLGALLKEADNIFYEALSRRNDKPGKGHRRIVVAPGGSDKYDISRMLGEEGWLEPDVAKTISDIYLLDMQTRPTGRKSIVENTLSAFEIGLSKIIQASTSFQRATLPKSET